MCIQNEIFDFIYELALRDATLQKAYAGSLDELRNNDKAKDYVKEYIDKLMKNELNDNSFLETATAVSFYVRFFVHRLCYSLIIKRVLKSGVDRMIYAMSDLHGCYTKYKKMLKKINLSENDTLYILGDIVDRGKNGIKILLDMMRQKNIVPLLGNHDFTAYSVLKHSQKENKPDWLESVRNDWLTDGGTPTEKAFLKLSNNEQESVLNYITDFSIYETVEIGDNSFILTHAGIDNFIQGKELHEYELYDFITGRMNYNKVYFDDFYLVSGHTPTGLIDKAYDGKIYRKNNHIAIDCGAAFERPLGCICLDTMEEFYEK